MLYPVPAAGTAAGVLPLTHNDQNTLQAHKSSAQGSKNESNTCAATPDGVNSGTPSPLRPYESGKPTEINSLCLSKSAPLPCRWPGRFSSLPLTPESPSDTRGRNGTPQQSATPLRRAPSSLLAAMSAPCQEGYQRVQTLSSNSPTVNIVSRGPPLILSVLAPAGPAAGPAASSLP